MTDLSGNGYNGTANGGVTVGGGAGMLTGVSDTSTDFDGSNDYISTTYTTRRNLITNPRAAVDTAGWTNTSLTTFARVASLPTTTGLPTGLDGGFRFVGDADGDNAAITIPVVSGTVYRVSFYVRLTSLSATGVLIRVVTAVPADHASSTTFATVGGGFTRIDVSFTANATANWTVQLRQSGAGAVDGHFTAVLTEAAASVGTYFDGAGYVNDSGTFITGTQKSGWLGTAHASASDKGLRANGTVRTFLALFRPPAWGAAALVLFASDTSSPVGCYFIASGALAFSPNNASSITWTTAEHGIVPGANHFLALEFDEPADTVSLYVNGTFISQKAMAAQYASEGNFKIGALGTAAYGAFDGLMQHVAVVEGALTAAQIQALYEVGAGGQYTIQGLNIGPPSKRLTWLARNEGDALGDVPDYERRTVTAKIRVPGASDKDEALDRLGTLVSKLQYAEQVEGGIEAIWQPAGGTYTGTLKVLAGEITELPIELTGDNAGWFLEHPVAQIRLDCKPFLYGDEVTETTVTNTDPMQFVTIATVTGDVPAEGRLIVSDAATQARDHVEWGVESGTTAQTATDLLLDSDDLTITGYAGTGTTRSGAYDPGGAGNSVIRLVTSPTWVAAASTGNQSHVGIYRVKARVYSTTADATARLSWRAGETAHVANPQTLPPLANQWAELDLGTIRIPETELGTQRWEGRVEVKADTAGANFDLDALWLIPAERYGKARATINASTPTVFSARDEFDQTAGALTGKTLPVGGGNWAGAGDANDFSVASSTAERTALSDSSGFATGRFAIAPPTALTNTAVRVSFRVSGVDAGSFQGVIARYTNVSNALAVYVDFDGTNRIVAVVKQVAGVTTTLATTEELAWSRSSTDWETVQLLVTATGVVFGWHNTGRTVVGEPILRAQDSVLATGGTLASGQAGFYDSWTSGTASTRSFDDFTMWVPALDRVIHSGQSLEVRSEDTLREDSTGTYWGRPPVYRGSRFFIPPAGDSANTARIVVKTRRGDVDLFADDQIADSTSAQIKYVPRWLVVPRS